MSICLNAQQEPGQAAAKGQQWKQGTWEAVQDLCRDGLGEISSFKKTGMTKFMET